MAYTAEEYEEAIAWLIRQTVASLEDHVDGGKRLAYAYGEYWTPHRLEEFPVALRDWRWPDDKGVIGGTTYYEDDEVAELGPPSAEVMGPPFT